MAALLPIVFAVAGGVCLVLVLLAAWQSVRSLLGAAEGPTGEAGSGGEPARRELLREKETLLGAIRELRFERDLGKVSEADLAQLEGRYRGRAREVLRQLDEEIEPHRDAARALIEAARGQGAAGTPDAAVAAKAEPADPTAGTVPVCGACGTHNEADASFCKKCGGKLRAETPT
jgi:hypothetical protein